MRSGVLVALVLGLAGPVCAELVRVDLEACGDGLISRDTTAPGRLDWLDLTLTVAQSREQVEADPDGWIAKGWRFATTEEVCRLFTRYSVVGPGGGPCPTTGAVQVDGIDADPLWEKLGVTFAWGPAESSWGFFGDSSDGLVGLAYIGSVFPAADTGYLVTDNLYPTDFVGWIVGHYLVRPSNGDHDAVVGDADNCPAVANNDQADGDGDGVGNVCDNCRLVANATQGDDDGDGVGNACECSPGEADVVAVLNPGFLQSFQPANQLDVDGDGRLNRCGAIRDNCPGVANPTQADQDGDGIGDACDGCPTVADPDQRDSDEDGIPDACQCGDTDEDGDVDLNDAVQIFNCVFGVTTCNVAIADTDYDPGAPGGATITISDFESMLDHFEIPFFGYDFTPRGTWSFSCPRRPAAPGAGGWGSPPPVPTALALADGVLLGQHDGSGNVVFKDVPVAAILERWTPPAPHPGFAGETGTSARDVSFWHRGDPPDCGAEGCLTLGVWAPRVRHFDADGKDILRPTVVSVHGGGMVGGDAAFCDRGKRASQVDAVQVSVNYRLGALGFLATQDLVDESPLGIAGNYALLDLIEQLKWVQANIHRFGGDTANVTIVGHSAGATLVSYLMASPLVYPPFVPEKLFHRVLPSSGAYSAGHVPELPSLPNPVPSPVLNDPFERATALLTALESPCIRNHYGSIPCAGFSSPLDCLRAQPLDAILQASASVSKHRLLRRSNIEEWWPVIDGYVLPYQPNDFVRAGMGESGDVALLAGTAAVEGFQFNVYSPDLPDHVLLLADPDLASYLDPANTEAEWLEELDVIANGNPSLPPALQSIYASLPKDLAPAGAVWGAYDALSGEGIFACPTLSFTHAAGQDPARTAPVHGFVFGYPNGLTTTATPASHVPGGLFDVDPTGNSLLMLITCQPPTPADAAGQAIATAMRTALSNFVHGLPLSPAVWPDRRGGSISTPNVAYFETATPGTVSQQTAQGGRCIALEGTGLVYPSEP